MPHFDIIRQAQPSETFRVKSIMGSYDMATNAVKEHFVGDIDLPADWNVGLIVGRSGSGKSTIARELFGDCIVDGYEYTHESILDDMPQGATVQEIATALTSVGFASPPSWLKPYSALSNGEKMRCDLARAILEKRDMFVFDEFTSVVDRTVAQIGSLAIQKAIRRGGQKFIAVSCHDDIEQWLMPDWVFNTDTMTLSTKDREEQKKNRPAINIEIYETKRKREYWEVFRKYHYLNHEINIAARTFVCYANGNIAAFFSLLPQPCTVRNLWRYHRIVVLPDYQGVGIGTKCIEHISDIISGEGKKISILTSSAAFIQSLRRSKVFLLARIGRNRTGKLCGKALKNTLEGKFNNRCCGERITASFEYIGKRGNNSVKEAKR